MIYKKFFLLPTAAPAATINSYSRWEEIFRKLNQPAQRLNINMEEKIPLFRKWSNWYLLLIIFLVLQIALYYYLTLRFS